MSAGGNGQAVDRLLLWTVPKGQCEAVTATEDGNAGQAERADICSQAPDGMHPGQDREDDFGCHPPKFMHVSGQNMSKFHWTPRQDWILILEILRTISLRHRQRKLKDSP